MAGQREVFLRKDGTMIDHIGQQIGNYRLERLLGSGGFADSTWASMFISEHRLLLNS